MELSSLDQPATSDSLRGTRTSQRHAFSFTELLLILTVIVAIIAVLGPSVYRARGRAKLAKCTSNLKVLGIWAGMYVTDYGDQTMPAFQTGWVAKFDSMPSDKGHEDIDQTAAPDNEWECPAQDFVSLKDGVSAADYWRGSNYGINEHMASNVKDFNGDPYPEWAQARIKSILNPGDKLWIADSSGGNYYDKDGLDPTVAGISQYGVTYAEAVQPTPARPLPYLRHMGSTGNFLFLDTHVETLWSFPVLNTGPNTRGYAFWHAEHAYPTSGKTMPKETRVPEVVIPRNPVPQPPSSGSGGSGGYTPPLPQPGR